jgi:squalene-hopene/tetraprenyl-beta-curcumene cyclase
MTVTHPRHVGRSAAGPAAEALARARDHLLGLQHDQGWWQGELETNVTMDAEDLLLREFLGVRTAEQTQAAARWIASQQRDDGTWANFYGGPGDLSTTVEAYVALRLAGHQPQAPHLARAAEWIRGQGGIPATRVFTRIWLALFGQWSWDDLPVMPPELIYLPAWFPFNVYDWACWARQTIVPLTIVGAFRPATPLPFGLKELWPAGDGPIVIGRRDRPKDPVWSAVFGGLDRALHVYERRGRSSSPAPRDGSSSPAPGVGSAAALPPPEAATLPPPASPRPGRRLLLSRPGRRLLFSRPSTPGGRRPSTPGGRHPATPGAAPVRAVRRAAIRRCAEWIIARQEADGCWGGIQPPWVYSLIALRLLGYGLDHPVMRRGLAGLDRFTITEDTPEGPVRRMEACQSPAWDTVLAMIALADAGLPADHPALTKAADWLLDEEITGPGDWQVRRPALAPGGWAFEFDNDNYPDIDDTAEVVLALRRVQSSGPDARRKAAIARGLTWITGMVSGDGGWAAFDADNTSRLVAKLPFCDFGAVTDPPSADVTAHVVEALAAMGQAGSRAARRGVVWLLRAQENDGSWFGRWGANYVYGTGAVVPALIAAGVQPGKPAIRRAVAWLEQHQNPDGGWGEDMRSYDEPSLAGHGASTASQTAWALLALLAAGGAEPAVDAGIRWLAEHQRSDGTWDEPQFTGTGFPRDFYLNYHLYRLVFPVSALGRYVSSPAPGDGSAAALPPRSTSPAPGDGSAAAPPPRSTSPAPGDGSAAAPPPRSTSPAPGTP